MPATVDIVLSIFGLIGVGYLTARFRLLGRSVVDGVAAFVFTIAIPMLLFRTLATAEFHGISPWSLWLPYYAAVVMVWIAGHVITRRVFGRDARAGTVAGASAGYSNLALIGLPLVQTVFGEPGTAILVLLLAVNLPVMMLAGTVLFELAVRADGVGVGPVNRRELARGFAVGMVRNPIFIGISAGLLWRLTGLPVSGPPGYVVEKLAQTAGPMALFVAGMSLDQFGVARQITPAFVISVLKLLALPTIVLCLALAAGLPGFSVQVLTISAACPTGVNATLLATKLGTGEALASNTLLISTASAVGTITAWLIVLQALAP